MAVVQGSRIVSTAIGTHNIRYKAMSQVQTQGCQQTDVRGTNAGVGDVSHSSQTVAVVQKDTLQLKLLHAGLNSSHDFTVSSTALLIAVPHHVQLHRSLDHTAESMDKAELY